MLNIAKWFTKNKTDEPTTVVVDDDDAIYREIAYKHRLAVAAESDVKVGMAISLATRAHEGQLRRIKAKQFSIEDDAGNNPPINQNEFESYIYHPIRVASKTKEVYPNVHCIIAAILHDVVEDTDVSLEDLETIFGNTISSLVDNLTKASFDVPKGDKPDGMNREARMQMDLEKLRMAHPYAKLIKLADLIDNSKSIQKVYPDFWKVYRKEKRALLKDPLLPQTTGSFTFAKAYLTLYQEAAHMVGLEDI